MEKSTAMGLMLVCVVVALLNVAAHWFPWHVIPGASDQAGHLRRLLAYGYGVLTIVIGMGGWATVCMLTAHIQVSPWMAVLALILIVVAAGAGTLAAYAVDLGAETKSLAADVAEFERRLGGM
jgi:hypothetical protein